PLARAEGLDHAVEEIPGRGALRVLGGLGDVVDLVGRVRLGAEEVVVAPAPGGLRSGLIGHRFSSGFSAAPGPAATSRRDSGSTRCTSSVGQAARVNAAQPVPTATPASTSEG